jgi:copper chaperone NosL
VAGLVDYYLWGYDYGHNLDMDRAIIKIPGMTYQPPLIGTKTLLNFKATSLPGTGALIMIAGFISVAASMCVEWVQRRRAAKGAQ